MSKIRSAEDHDHVQSYNNKPVHVGVKQSSITVFVFVDSSLIGPKVNDISMEVVWRKLYHFKRLYPLIKQDPFLLCLTSVEDGLGYWL